MILIKKRVGRDHPINIQPLETAKIEFIVMTSCSFWPKKRLKKA